LLKGKILPRSFYSRDPAIVASDLLGNRLIRVTDNGMLEGMIVETEAYFGFEDPASRAYHGKKIYNRLMWEETGRIFIYNVHRYWMFNIVAHEEGHIGAVLIRAVEPIQGIEIMIKNRPVLDIRQLTSGPGKFTQAFGIDKGLQGLDLAVNNDEIRIIEGISVDDFGTSKRIGVRRDLDKELRFFIKGNKYLSR
jgi:DNA-3-methyladenine glycosylase